MSFHLPKERVDAIANQVVAALEKSAGVEVRNPDGIRAAVRAVMTENLRQEYELEQEVLAMLRQHGQEIFESKADFHKMFQDGKRILAKKKGFTL